MRPALCIAGPTAAGKTDAALALAERWPVEIISVDSAQVYRHLDIGTAKPSGETRRRVPHHLVDIRDPWERYSAGEFRGDALRLIERIGRSARLPLLVGGTMLYFRSLLRGLAPLPAADPVLRERIDAEAAQRGWPAMHRELSRVDPAAAARIDPADRQRIQRALEVFRLTGEPISRLQQRAAGTPLPKLHCFALMPPSREWLNARIESRFRAMLAAGFVDEVRRLRAMPRMSGELPSMRAVGYRQLWKHLAGECALEDAVRLGMTATRRYAKRQLPWLRSEPAFSPLLCGHPDTARRLSEAAGAAWTAGA